MSHFIVHSITPSDLSYIRDVFIERWDADFVVSRGKKHYPQELEGLIAEDNGKKIGLITFEVIGEEMEITSVDSFRENAGVGTALIEKAVQTAKERALKRVVLVTTNDNLNALRFYQRRGFVLSRVYPNAIEQARKLKPSIPLMGEHGISLRDEIELEIVLT